MELTSARINKLIKAIDAEKQALLLVDERDSTYTFCNGEVPVRPNYDFNAVSDRISTLNERVMLLRHALNSFNVSHVLPCGYTIDKAIIRMSQLECEKKRLIKRASVPATERVRGYNAINPDYTAVNYELKDAKKRLNDVCKEIASLQLELDSENCTVPIETCLTQQEIEDINYTVNV